MQLIEKTATEHLQALRMGEITAVELTSAYVDAIRERDEHTGCFLHCDIKAALQIAEEIDRRRKAQEELGPLAGLPIAVKDILCVQGEPTTCASKILENYIPPYDAHVIGRLKEADAIPLGKTNLDEFAMGSSTENSAFKITRNPWHLDYVPGGSSGGSAAAVAACEAPVAIASDTGGSIRLPASFCGIVGVKPSYGRVSRYGLIAYASSFDQIGPMAHSVQDAALLLEAIAGYDPRDSTSIDHPVPSYTHTLEQPLQPLTIGIPKEYFEEGLHPEVDQAVQAALDVYQQNGAKIKKLSLPRSQYAIATYYIVATAEASSNLARYDGVHYGYRSQKYDSLIHMYSRSRGEGFGKEVKRRIMLGTYVLSSGYYEAYYKKALQVRRLIQEDFHQAFAECDVLISPTSPTPAFKIGEKIEDPLAMYLIDIYTISANLVGIPSISIPCGFTSDGLPVGLQIMAPAFEEERMFRVARTYERVTDWHLRRPKLTR